MIWEYYSVSETPEETENNKYYMHHTNSVIYKKKKQTWIPKYSVFPEVFNTQTGKMNFVIAHPSLS